MSIFDRVIAALFADLNTEEIRVMRRTGTKILWRCWLAGFSAFALGWLAIIGLDGFVRANEVDRRITVAVLPISNQLVLVKKAVDENGAAQRVQTLQLLRQQIIDAKVKKCRSSKFETAEIYRRIVKEAQDQHWALTGQFYPEPPCSDL